MPPPWPAPPSPLASHAPSARRPPAPTAPHAMAAQCPAYCGRVLGCEKPQCALQCSQCADTTRIGGEKPPEPANLTADPALWCLRFPPLLVSGTQLIANDGSGRRFFAVGMVAGGERPLRISDPNEMEAALATSAKLGATALRYNAFLKGLDFKWRCTLQITCAFASLRVAA